MKFGLSVVLALAVLAGGGKWLSTIPPGGWPDPLFLNIGVWAMGLLAPIHAALRWMFPTKDSSGNKSAWLKRYGPRLLIGAVWAVAIGSGVLGFQPQLYGPAKVAVTEKAPEALGHLLASVDTWFRDAYGGLTGTKRGEAAPAAEAPVRTAAESAKSQAEANTREAEKPNDTAAPVASSQGVSLDELKRRIEEIRKKN